MKPTNQIRILLVGPYPPPFGGIASHLTSLIPGILSRVESEIAVVSFGDRNSVDHVKGTKVYRFNIKSNARKLLQPLNWKYLLLAFKIMGRQNLSYSQIIKEATKTMLVDHVAIKFKPSIASFYQADLSLNLLPLSQLWQTQTKVFLTVFGEIYDNPEFISENLKLFKNLLAIPNAVLASSKHCANSFSKLGIERAIEPVYYGIELNRFRECEEAGIKFRERLNVKTDEVLVMYMGRFTADMGLSSVLKVIPSILEVDTKIKFLLAGAKGELSDDAKHIANTFPEKIFIMNNVSFDDQPAIYAASDLVLAPTRDQHACMGMSIKEAMATSKAVIGSISGGIPEAIVDGETGILIPLGEDTNIEIEKFKEAILLLSKNKETRVQFGIAGQKRAETMFSSETTIDRMLGFFMG